MPPKTRTSSSPTKPLQAPSTMSTHIDDENTTTPSDVAGLPDSQSTVTTDVSPQTDNPLPPPQLPDLTPTLAPAPLAKAKQPRLSLSRADSVHFQAEVATLSDGQSTADKKLKETALACARNRIDDRKTVEARLAELNTALRQLIHDELQPVKQDLSSLREDMSTLTELVTAAHDGLEAHTNRLGHHDNDLKDLMTELRGVSEGVDRLEEDVLKRVAECRSEIKSLRTDFRTLKTEVSAHHRTRRIAQDDLDDLASRLSTIEDDILPAIIDHDAAHRRFGRSKPKAGKGKQRATSSDLDSSDDSDSWSPYHEESDDSDSAGWHGVLGDNATTHQSSMDEPGPSNSHKRQRDPTPENQVELHKRPRETVSPVPTAPAPLAHAELISMPVLPPSIPGSQPPANPPISSLSTLNGPPDLLPTDAFERGIIRITMKNLEGTDFFHPTDKMHNYNLFRRINVFLGANCFPALTPEPEGNTPISTTETSFSYTRPTDVRSVLTSWRLRPESLSNLRIYEDSTATTAQDTQPSVQSTALQQILAADAPTSSRGRGSGRGHPSGRGLPSGRGHPLGRGYGIDRQPSRGSLRGTGGGNQFYDPSRYY